MSSGYKRLGEILIDKGYVSEENLSKALSLQASSNARLGDIVSSMGWATEDQVTQCLAEQYCYDVIDLKDIDCKPEALAFVNNQRALRNLILPIEQKDGYLHCVVGDPINVVPIDELRSAQKLPLRIFMASPSLLRESIIQQYFKETKNKTSQTKLRRHKIDSQTDRASLLKALEFETEKQNKRFA